MDDDDDDGDDIFLVFCSDAYRFRKIVEVEKRVRVLLDLGFFKMFFFFKVIKSTIKII